MRDGDETMYTVDLGHGIKTFPTLDAVSAHVYERIAGRVSSRAWSGRIAKRGGSALKGAPIFRDGVVVACVSYNGRIWDPAGAEIAPGVAR